MITLVIGWKSLAHYMVSNLQLAQRGLVLAAVEQGENIDNETAVQARLWGELIRLGLDDVSLPMREMARIVCQLAADGKLVEFNPPRIDIATLNPLVSCHGALPLTGKFRIHEAVEAIGFQLGSDRIRVM